MFREGPCVRLRGSKESAVPPNLINDGPRRAIVACPPPIGDLYHSDVRTRHAWPTASILFEERRCTLAFSWPRLK